MSSLCQSSLVNQVFVSPRAWAVGTLRDDGGSQTLIVIADAETGKVIKEGRVGDEIWQPVWSADSKTAAYGARLGRELWWKVEKPGE